MKFKLLLLSLAVFVCCQFSSAQSTNTLYAFGTDANNQHLLLEIDQNTGEATLIGPTGISNPTSIFNQPLEQFPGIQIVADDNAGIIYALETDLDIPFLNGGNTTAMNFLHTIDPVTGAATFDKALTSSITGPSGLAIYPVIVACAFNPADNMIYAVGDGFDIDVLQFGGFLNSDFLWRIDPSTGTITQIADIRQGSIAHTHSTAFAFHNNTAYRGFIEFSPSGFAYEYLGISSIDLTTGSVISQTRSGLIFDPTYDDFRIFVENPGSSNLLGVKANVQVANFPPTITKGNELYEFDPTSNLSGTLTGPFLPPTSSLSGIEITDMTMLSSSSVTPTPVPTMGEWALIVCGIMMLGMAVVVLPKRF